MYKSSRIYLQICGVVCFLSRIIYCIVNIVREPRATERHTNSIERGDLPDKITKIGSYITLEDYDGTYITSIRMYEIIKIYVYLYVSSMRWNTVSRDFIKPLCNFITYAVTTCHPEKQVIRLWYINIIQIYFSISILFLNGNDIRGTMNYWRWVSLLCLLNL